MTTSYKIDDTGNGIWYLPEYLSSRLLLFFLMWDENWKLPNFFIRLVIAFVLGSFLYFIKATSTSLELFSVNVASSFSVNIPLFLTILTKYYSNVFAVLVSLWIISSFSIYLIGGLALILFEKRRWTLCQNFLLSKTEFTSRFAKLSFLFFFQEVNTKISLLFDINQKQV